MSADEVETKEQSACSSSASVENETPVINSSSNAVSKKPNLPNFNLRHRMLQRKVQSRQAGFISGSIVNTTNSDILSQRVLSARQHRQRGLQNQLNVVLQQNAELITENRLLRTLHKRQDNALSKYENSACELPQLIKSHSEELRVWQTKYRALNVQNRELNKKIQQKDKTLNELSDRIKHLTTLTTEKHLEEREVLTNKAEALERQLDIKDEEIKLLTRRNALEAKNFRTQLINERRKFKEMSQKPSIDKRNEKSSSIDSDYSSAKESKETQCDSRVMRPMNAMSMSSSSDIDKESPPINLHMDIEDNDDDDDDDLVIKQIPDQTESVPMQKKPTTDINNSKQIAKQLANISLKIQQKMKKDIEKTETLLDLHCDEISRDVDSTICDENASTYRSTMSAKPWHGFISSSKSITSSSNDTSKIPRTASNLPRFNISLGKPEKRTPIDSQRKSKLLAQLKSIESNNL